MNGNLDQVKGEYLGNAVYGALDGTVTTFAIIAGSLGAGLPSEAIVVLALASLLADGFSMSTGSYLSERSKEDYRKHLVKLTKGQLNENPGLIKDKILRRYQEKGWPKKLIEAISQMLAQKPQVLRAEAIEEVSIEGVVVKPIHISLITFGSFVIVGFLPVIPLLLLAEAGFWSLLFLVALVLFLVGSLRSQITRRAWWLSGLEMMLAGTAASFIAYFTGKMLAQVFGLTI